ncbi:hypothetical protein [Stieleria mannarensis]|uniref:hypothetical protein n=1 Tax=Stieleria mannarensis TaxID=2755585 RepID=UPI0016009728|nr:hypothetical protein [Rhodopirellula sp. JC639]
MGITVHHRGITTESDEAQRYFDQGLNFAYAFDHDEAFRSFQQALRFDQDCAMAWWGIGLCHGPHINNPAMDDAIRSRMGGCRHANPVDLFVCQRELTYQFGDNRQTRISRHASVSITVAIEFEHKFEKCRILA